MLYLIKILSLSSSLIKKVIKFQWRSISLRLTTWRPPLTTNLFLLYILEEESVIYHLNSVQLTVCLPKSEVIQGRWETFLVVAEKILRKSSRKFKSFAEHCLARKHWKIGESALRPPHAIPHLEFLRHLKLSSRMGQLLYAIKTP